MKDFNYTQPFIVIGALIVRDGNILLIQENHYPDQGKWNIPAGKLDFGENPVDAVTREAFEESGLKFTPTALLGIHSVHRKDVPGEVHALRIVFVGEAAGEVTLEYGQTEGGVAEISAYKWLTPEAVLDMPDAELRYHDIKAYVRMYLTNKTYPLEFVQHITQKPNAN